MREKPLSKIGDELLRLRHGLSGTSEHRTPPTGFGVDRSLVSGFVEGALSPQDEAELAGQMAGLMPFHWSQPNSFASIMSQVTDHLGGQRELMAWLDRFPGRPRLVARLYVLMGLLDRYSESTAVVTALREHREETPYPAGLKGYLVPETDDETLAGIAFRIEELLGDGDKDKAVDLALATTDCLRRIAPRAEELDPGIGDLGEVMEHSGQDIREAAAEAGSGS
ncbi:MULTISPECIES: hypothetical protein [unclassified Streptomyces]|uniref:hypothetical protein n=1 Tax=unclassified Streptomyces TaxID=2593676 RepID=UPI0011CE0E3B|nr:MULTISPECIES: hypothetical protein [unclassified Streptomyces]TXS72580.1 hypothetical protein EAO69_15075 [Streptomyces sp. me109]